MGGLSIKYLTPLMVSRENTGPCQAMGTQRWGYESWFEGNLATFCQNTEPIPPANKILENTEVDPPLSHGRKPPSTAWPLAHLCRPLIPFSIFFAHLWTEELEHQGREMILIPEDFRAPTLFSFFPLFRHRRGRNVLQNRAPRNSSFSTTGLPCN